MQEITLTAVAKMFSDEPAAWEYMEQLRWDGKPVCALCGSPNVAYLAPRTDTSRLTKTGRVSHRRVWKCSDCKRQFSVLIGTIFEGTKIPLNKWLMTVYLMSAGKNGMSAMEVHRDLGITYKSAWFMVHRIREAMAHSPNTSKLFGIVIADETFVGGDPGNRHAKNRTTAKHHTDKTAVISIVDKRTGEIRSQVIPDVKAATVGKVINENVDKLGSILHTDGGINYKTIGGRFVKHESVNHSAGEYVRGDVSTNILESHFAQFKRSLDGTFHNVSTEHLQRYANEFDFRRVTRKMSDGERSMEMFRRSEGAAISYRGLISSGPVAMGTRKRPPGRPGPRRAAHA